MGQVGFHVIGRREVFVLVLDRALGPHHRGRLILFGFVYRSPFVDVDVVEFLLVQFVLVEKIDVDVVVFTFLEKTFFVEVLSVDFVVRCHGPASFLGADNRHTWRPGARIPG
ncbi:MAG: hypothetical protein FGM45_09610 [Actinobacteria bacterium]|nr:hypothetical protein [Actinomycetota bacterium]